MVHLDRENGAILLPNGSVVPYDILVLCTGLQVRTVFTLRGRSTSRGVWGGGMATVSPPGVHRFINKNPRYQKYLAHFRRFSFPLLLWYLGLTLLRYPLLVSALLVPSAGENTWLGWHQLVRHCKARQSLGELLQTILVPFYLFGFRDQPWLVVDSDHIRRGGGP